MKLAAREGSVRLMNLEWSNLTLERGYF